MILTVTKKQGFTLSLENTFLKKQEGGVKLTPPLAFLGLKETVGNDVFGINFTLLFNKFEHDFARK